MPELRKIVVQNFRNIELQELEFSGKLNCITGGNGEGKRAETIQLLQTSSDRDPEAHGRHRAWIPGGSSPLVR